jgi:hypothetical protein
MCVRMHTTRTHLCAVGSRADVAQRHDEHGRLADLQSGCVCTMCVLCARAVCTVVQCLCACVITCVYCPHTVQCNPLCSGYDVNGGTTDCPAGVYGPSEVCEVCVCVCDAHMHRCRRVRDAVSRRRVEDLRRAHAQILPVCTAWVSAVCTLYICACIELSVVR